MNTRIFDEDEVNDRKGKNKKKYRILTKRKLFQSTLVSFDHAGGEDILQSTTITKSILLSGPEEERKEERREWFVISRHSSQLAAQFLAPLVNRWE